ncbi:ABC transporter permease [Peribacillus asahii]|uniref:ABC transporter permease n=1 Tax=Peribacillus asahii TaxID=228899 RepID=A0A398B4N1_9BACI|nr:ABC transporter permease subunit [Peribacillus asahii]RID82726.1 ABC transporter permease [Peribacillus asahii]
MWNIWRSELRMTVRQRSYYSFLILWVAVLSLLFLLQNSAPSLTGYTNMTGTVANIALYIIPLFMLIIGSFSIANEIENGQWRLLCTYPLFTLSYVIGKIGGQFTAQWIVFTFSFGISMAISLVIGGGFSMKWLWAIYLFSVTLLFIFLVIGVCIGSFVKTRWQALSISVMLWFFLIMIWPTALIGILGSVPYTWIAPLMNALLFVNPAELIRVAFVISLDAGSVFGQAYDSLLSYLETSLSILIYILYFICFLSVSFLFSMGMLEWRKRR